MAASPLDLSALRHLWCPPEFDAAFDDFLAGTCVTDRGAFVMTHPALRPLLALLVVLLAQPGHAVDCGMAASFQQKDGNAKGGVTAVWSDPAGEGIERWSLWLRTGESALNVAYGRPLLQAAPGSAVAFAAPALGVRGSLTFTQLRSVSAQPIPRLPLPPGWTCLPADSLLPLLEGFSPPSE